MNLESVNLDLVFLCDLVINQESMYVLALVALKLNNLTKLLVFNNVTVTAEFLFKGLEDLFVIKALLQALICTKRKNQKLKQRNTAHEDFLILCLLYHESLT